jgi:hypothetical protein
MKNKKSNDEFPVETSNEEMVKKGLEEAADEVAKYYGCDNNEVPWDFEHPTHIIFPERKISSKEIAEIMAKSLNEENWKELENMGVIIKKERNDE